jgi:hypothetical protein
MRLLRLTLCGLWVLACLVPQLLKSQDGPEEVSPLNDCRLAEQVLVHGQSVDKYSWALRVIEDCGPGGADAIAHELRDLRNVRERTADLDQLSASARRLVDVALFRAGMDIAGDETAGEAARVHAIALIVAQVTRTDPGYEALITDPTTGGAFIVGAVTSHEPSTLRELPAGSCGDALSLLKGLAAAEGSSVVRLAADQASYTVEAQCCLAQREDAED